MRLIPTLSLALALVVAAPLTAGAQRDTVPAPRDTFPAPQIPGSLLEPIAGVRIGFPQKASVFVASCSASDALSHFALSHSRTLALRR